VSVGESEGAPALSKDERKVVVLLWRGGLIDVDDTNPLVGRPDGSHGSHYLGEAPAIIRREVHEHRAVEDDERGIRGSFGRDVRGQVEQIAADDVGGVFSSNRNGGAQPLDSMELVRPDPRLKPARVIVVGNVEGVDIDPPAPNNTRKTIRNWSWSFHIAGELQWALRGSPTVRCSYR
jgi:hypothetical protein